MRHPKPWRRSEGGAWYAWVGGKQFRLADGRQTKGEAQLALNQILGERAKGKPTPTGRLRVRDILALFESRQANRQAKGEIVAGTLEHYTVLLARAVAHMGDRYADTLTPDEVKAWAASQPRWKQARRRAAIQAVRSAFRHAIRAGLLPLDPLADLKPPAAVRREFDATARIRARLASAATDEAWAAFLEACIETGCRPGEVAAVRAVDFDPEAGTWQVPNKTKWATGRAYRTVHLTTRMVTVSRELATRHPAGPLFRNSQGNPWKRWAWGGRMRRAREKLGLPSNLVTYSLRGAFITDAIEKGVNVAIIAELAGHDIAMIQKNYSNVAQRRSILHDALSQIRPGEPAPPPSAETPTSGTNATLPPGGSDSDSGSPLPARGSRGKRHTGKR